MLRGFSFFTIQSESWLAMTTALGQLKKLAMSEGSDFCGWQGGNEKGSEA